MLIALNEETIKLHAKDLVRDGLIVFDREKVETQIGQDRLFHVPFERLALEKI